VREGAAKSIGHGFYIHQLDLDDFNKGDMYIRAVGVRNGAEVAKLQDEITCFSGGSSTARVPIPKFEIQTPRHQKSVTGVESVVVSVDSTVHQVSSVTLYLNGTLLTEAVTSAPYVFDWDTTRAPQGINVLTARILEGTDEKKSSFPIGVFAGGTPISPIDINEPAMNAVLSIDPTPVVNTSLNLNNGEVISNIQYLLNGALFNYPDGLLKTNLDGGEHAVTVIGNSNQRETVTSLPIYFHNDRLSPFIYWKTPADGVIVSHDVTFDFDAWDSDQVQSVAIDLDGSPLATLAAPPYQYIWDSDRVDQNNRLQWN